MGVDAITQSVGHVADPLFDAAWFVTVRGGTPNPNAHASATPTARS
jgi:hypothetical protein